MVFFVIPSFAFRAIPALRYEYMFSIWAAGTSAVALAAREKASMILL
jgi:hypothetical protein